MNENLEKQLAKVVEKAIEAAERTGEFVVEQAPDLLREFYTWHTTRLCISVVLCLLLLIGILFWLRYVVKNSDYLRRKDLDMPHIMGIALCGIPVIGTLIVQGFSLIKILVAPKLYLIEYFI